MKKIWIGVSTIGSFLAAIAYGIRGGDVLSAFSTTAEILLVLAVVLNAIEFVKPLPMLEYVPYALTICSLGVFLRIEMDFLANVYTGLDGNSLDTLLILIFVGMGISVIAGAAVIITGASRPKFVVVAET